MVRQRENGPRNGEKLDDGAGGKWTGYVVHRNQTMAEKVVQDGGRKLDSIFSADWAGILLGTVK